MIININDYRTALIPVVLEKGSTVLGICKHKNRSKRGKSGTLVEAKVDIAKGQLLLNRQTHIPNYAQSSCFY